VTTDISRNQLIDCLIAAYNGHKQEGVWDTNESEEEYLTRLKSYSIEQLIEETCTDEEFTMEEFLYAWS
tara:strand:- start:146 stop:352 length:207 start_codon:yes stop_codon:yes gene_type:complete